jgi:hypothetical protein
VFWADNEGFGAAYSSLMFSSIPNWLVSADPPRHADLIFVLAGLQSRKSFGLELVKNGMVPRILLSVGRYEIRRFANLPLPQHLDLLQMAQSVPHPLRHYFVYFAEQGFEVQLIPAKGLGTLRELEALSEWLEKHPVVKSLLVVSSGSHLRRVRMCCEALLPRNIEFHLVAAAEEVSSSEGRNWLSERQTRKTLLLEFVKILAYSSVLPLRRIAKIWHTKRSKVRTD